MNSICNGDYTRGPKADGRERCAALCWARACAEVQGNRPSADGAASVDSLSPSTRMNPKWPLGWKAGHPLRAGPGYRVVT